MVQEESYCPSCGRVIEAGSPSCQWCGARRPGFRNRLFAALASREGEGVVRLIIAANLLFYLLSLLLSRQRLGGGLLTFLSPDQTSLLLLGATGAVPVLELKRYWTLISANYLHGGLLHILFNMVALRQIGLWVCAEFGPSRMFVIYTAGGVFGYLVSCVAGVPYTVGASASVCGLIGALYYFGRSRGGSYGSAVSREVSGWLLSLLLFGLLIPAINNWGHGGGLVGGALCAMLLGYRERRRDSALYLALALFCLILTALVLFYAAASSLVIWFG